MEETTFLPRPIVIVTGANACVYVICKVVERFLITITAGLAMGFAKESFYNFARLLHRIAVHKPLLLKSRPMNLRNQRGTLA